MRHYSTVGGINDRLRSRAMSGSANDRSAFVIHGIDVVPDSASNIWDRASVNKADPTNTTAYRKKGKTYIKSQFEILKRQIRSAIIAQDILGTSGPQQNPSGWTFSVFMGSEFDKSGVINSMFDSMIKTTVLNPASTIFSGIAIDGYRAGVDHARMFYPNASINPVTQRNSITWVRSSVVQELEGIMATVVQQMSRAARLEVAMKNGPANLYHKLTEIVDKVGMVRINALINHAVVQGHAFGTLDIFEGAKVKRVGVVAESKTSEELVRGNVSDARANLGPGSMLKGRKPSRSTLYRIRKSQERVEALLERQKVAVLTAGDEFVCERCEAIAEDGPYTLNQARGLIPAHPDCRCVFIPASQSTGDADKDSRKEYFEWKESDLIIEKKKVDDKYNPNQPREPAGSSEGGQWVGTGGTSPHGFLSEEASQRYGNRDNAFDAFREQSLKQPLTLDEKAAFHEYTYNKYIMNDHLRANEPLLSMYQGIYEDLKSGMSKASLAEDTVVYRGFGKSLDKIGIGNGDTFFDRGFASTTSDLTIAEDFGCKNIVEIRLPKGATALPLGRLSKAVDENEILIDAGARFRVESVRGRYILHWLPKTTRDAYNPNQPRDPAGLRGFIDDRPGMDGYVGEESPFRINSGLREGSLDDQDIDIVNELTDTIEGSPLQSDIEVYRGFDASSFGNLSVGSVLTDKGFVSTSLSEMLATDFALGMISNDVNNPNPTVMQIKLPIGTKAAIVRGSVEEEVILQRGTSFRIDQIIKSAGMTRLVVSIASQSTPQRFGDAMHSRFVWTERDDEQFTADKYNPNQPRDPQGTPTGGRWTRIGSNASSLYEAPTKTSDELIAEQEGAAEKIQEINRMLADGIPTDALVSEGGFRNPDGTYTDERARLHDEILDRTFSAEAIAAATPAPGQQPILSVLGGRGGSGKSWISTNPNGPLYGANALMLDTDEFKKQLPGYAGWNAALFHEESTHIFERANARAAALGLNVINDATLKSEATTALRIAQFQSKGYQVHGYYMYASPETAARRAMARFATGGTFQGRYVPPSIIYSNTQNEKNFDTFSRGMRRWAVYDNSVDGRAPALVSASWQRRRA